MKPRLASTVRQELSKLLLCPLCDRPVTEDDITIGASGHDELVRIWCSHCRDEHQAPPFLMFFSALPDTAQSDATAAALAIASDCPHCGSRVSENGVLGVTLIGRHYWIAVQCLTEECGIRFYAFCDQRASDALSQDDVIDAHETLRGVTSLSDLFSGGLPALDAPVASAGTESPSDGLDCQCRETAYWSQINSVMTDPPACPRHPLPPQHC